MKETHETTHTQEQVQSEDNKIYTPLEDLLRAEGNPPKDYSKVGSLPKGIRLIGYILIGGMAILTLAAMVVSLFN
ncbi:hypothetical protein [Falsibacillus pallidus]|uniref:Uncharacterized protein n=1 Tax=Falsibacillus pallidus TaxID=493781 RepID=A0A370GXK5_9BACI|nr:hypothetical protein [Falsibacillus pallidus]RDI47990.1 hypothetical protein DFR59_101657 [Falsibacillus pallidus]